MNSGGEHDGDRKTIVKEKKRRTASLAVIMRAHIIGA